MASPYLSELLQFKTKAAMPQSQSTTLRTASFCLCCKNPPLAIHECGTVALFQSRSKTFLDFFEHFRHFKIPPKNILEDFFLQEACIFLINNQLPVLEWHTCTCIYTNESTKKIKVLLSLGYPKFLRQKIKYVALIARFIIFLIIYTFVVLLLFVNANVINHF